MTLPHALDVSAAQRSMWFGQRLDPAGPAYNVGEYTEIHGPVDPVRFRAAVQQVVAATETLRARFTADDDTVRQLVDTDPAWDLPVVDLTGEAHPGRPRRPGRPPTSPHRSTSNGHRSSGTPC